MRQDDFFKRMIFLLDRLDHRVLDICVLDQLAVGLVARIMHWLTFRGVVRRLVEVYILMHDQRLDGKQHLEQRTLLGDPFLVGVTAPGVQQGKTYFTLKVKIWIEPDFISPGFDHDVWRVAGVAWLEPHVKNKRPIGIRSVFRAEDKHLEHVLSLGILLDEKCVGDTAREAVFE